MKLQKEKIKQLLLIFLGIFLIGIGYLNSSFEIENENNLKISKRDGNDINIGDVELVNSKPVENYISGNIVPNDELIFENLKTENSTTNIVDENEKSKNLENEIDYFEETRIERQRMYSEMIEVYEEIARNQEIPNDQKAISIQEISNITNIRNGIMISENLIKNKGFEDVIILINNDTASVVVKAYNLNTEEISQIQNIIQRELKIDVKNINISNKF